MRRQDSASEGPKIVLCVVTEIHSLCVWYLCVVCEAHYKSNGMVL